jgi:hypothetical protein
MRPGSVSDLTINLLGKTGHVVGRFKRTKEDQRGVEGKKGRDILMNFPSSFPVGRSKAQCLSSISVSESSMCNNLRMVSRTVVK